MRRVPVVISLTFLLLCATHGRAQETSSATMAETVAWIGAQGFRLEASYPDAPYVTIDQRATAHPEFTYGTRGGLEGQHFHSGCAEASYLSGGVVYQLQLCGLPFVRTPLSIQAPADCSGNLTLRAEVDVHEGVTIWTGPTYAGEGPYRGAPDMYNMTESASSGTAHVRTQVQLPLGEFVGASDRPTSGSQNERFWLMARDSRDVIRLTTEVTSSRFSGGGQRTTLVHEIMLMANSRDMSARLTHAFQHLADLCATARPAEPF